MITKKSLTHLPRATGVYLMKDDAGEVLYVGKAVDLRRRVASYFGTRAHRWPLTQSLSSRAAGIDYILTDTEKEALLLENTLIKEHRPRYNIDLKDDKTYAHICLSIDDDYPRLRIVRRPKKKDGRCFGPYTSADAARRTLRFLQKYFRLRSCSESRFRLRARPCIKHEIKRCSAPCRGLIGRDDYRKRVERVVLFLGGRSDELLRLLETEMQEAADALQYERAAELRNAITAMRRTLERQKSIMADGAERDVLGLYVEGTRGEAVILCIRGGRLVGKKAIALDAVPPERGAALREIIIQHYTGGAFIPAEILLPFLLEDAKAVAAVLADERQGRVRLFTPQRGAKRALVQMAVKNAEESFRARSKRKSDTARILGEAQKKFGLAGLPDRIECVDISNIGGDTAVGALVAFHGGEPYKDGYRRYEIKTVLGSDDCAMIHEVVSRRLRAEDESPDLLIIDGGKGQLSAGLRAAREAPGKDVAIIALAKERDREEKRSPERVYLPNRKNPFILRDAAPLTLFMKRIRDEAHRFAITYHRKKRRRQLTASSLDGIPGIGTKRRALLLREFGDVRAVRDAPLDKLEKVLKNKTLARRVREHGNIIE